MVMVYQNLIFPRSCPSMPVNVRQCPSLSERNHCVIALNRALAQAIPQELCSSMLVRPVNASKARKESLCDSARAMLFNVSKARKESLCDSARAYALQC